MPSSPAAVALRRGPHCSVALAAPQPGMCQSAPCPSTLARAPVPAAGREQSLLALRKGCTDEARLLLLRACEGAMVDPSCVAMVIKVRGSMLLRCTMLLRAPAGQARHRGDGGPTAAAAARRCAAGIPSPLPARAAAPLLPAGAHYAASVWHPSGRADA